MYVHKLLRCPNHGLAFGSFAFPVLSRTSIVTHAKRKGVGKGLRELQQLASPLSANTTSTTSSSSIVSNNSTTSSSSSGPFDSLLVRILASVAAIMAVISVFYSIVFYGASNAVYFFKDQLAVITKKDFVPYSERRRLEQVEVLAKLEAEQAERLKAREAGGEAAVVAGEEGAPEPSRDSITATTAAAAGGGVTGAAAGVEEDASSSAELLNLLPSSSGSRRK
ncbi:hypothetical protein VOLCADRAFT_94074 [Volvox carteri f. nagariensis]|uniref:Transmembrane protein n=1 Tax=Volvox carteri f. nagariensis TaxID=3068 RepID=D8U3U8_VOLCA|nr:uncharacterized protein VOLCADRAFT_94074 [Volvox carteri f. nagariensis]EFJ45591.1 hypothetical protein VOLCADRAFT_94074 [Volvox carteri f. nagariensis]|eukprot:XP_002953281.1 hypothetical protein VOLCADRAFT_94074 [Volvox carteri f. nagariensis]